MKIDFARLKKYCMLYELNKVKMSNAVYYNNNTFDLKMQSELIILVSVVLQSMPEHAKMNDW